MLQHIDNDAGEWNDSDIRALLISDVESADSLRVKLERSPIDMHYSQPGALAIAAVVRARPQVLLVDCRSNETQALQLCASLRSVDELSSALLIAITLDDRDDLRIRAFDAGADDCFAEPPTSRELVSRLDVVRRRIKKDSPSEVLRYADIELDLRRHKVRRNGGVVWMPRLQMQLLKFFMENPAVVFTRRELLEAVWGDTTLDEGTVTVCIVRLRRALNSTGRPNLIRQVRGIGYALDADLDR